MDNNNIQNGNSNQSDYNGFNNNGNYNDQNHVMIPCPACGRLNFPAAKKCINCGKKIPKSESALGIVALVLTLICCTFGIGLLLAIIDLIVGRNGGDGKGHICSWISICIGGGLIVLYLFSSALGGIATGLEEKRNSEPAVESEVLDVPKEGDGKVSEEDVEAARIKTINEEASRIYSNALKHIEDGKYTDAYELLLKISNESDYYDDAVNKMAEIKNLVIEENVNNAESAYEKELYSLALSYIDTALQYDPDDEDISQRKEEYTALLVEQLKTSAADKSAEQNYEKAVELIKEALTYYADDEELLALLDTYEELLSAQIAEKEAAEIAAASLYTGKVLNTNHAEVTVKNIDIVDHIYPEKRSGYYLYYSVSETDTTWFHIELKVKNTSSGVLNLYSMIENPTITYDGMYDYSTYAVYYSKGSNIDRMYSWYTETIDPLETCTVHVVVECPIDVKTSDKSLTGSIKIDGTSQDINYR